MECVGDCGVVVVAVAAVIRVMLQVASDAEVVKPLMKVGW